MAKQVGVYIDHMNAYNGARRAFLPPGGGPSVEGQYWPLALGGRIIDQGLSDRELKFVESSAACRTPERVLVPTVPAIARLPRGGTRRCRSTRDL